MTAQFPHHSRPGYYEPALDQEIQRYLATVAEALIPRSEEYPSGAEAQVVHFIAERASEADAATLAEVAKRWPAVTVGEAVEALSAMETEDSLSFLLLREFVYHGYYSSRRVLAAMVDRGYRYHGAPQPLGYPATEELLVPSQRRGAYIPTDEVKHVANRPA